jgi:hypothetical protein
MACEILELAEYRVLSMSNQTMTRSSALQLASPNGRADRRHTRMRAVISHDGEGRSGLGLAA